MLKDAINFLLHFLKYLPADELTIAFDNDRPLLIFTENIRYALAPRVDYMEGEK